ncbi:reverse transcriptase domain, Reverse transcriptase zinc-binding domain protein [Artemisia annua]|uniref:Reverse transcriptase domain, Reverse transcriptase zinc-binding domain protein n=1 Tax=Artemisia annua TaxID=35608 RepID=A0A2U1KK12_ARTAN|nr:reverse transcriptase domain, Reverse transcriptase zinc-binding domain protein [Artemisia annua]
MVCALCNEDSDSHQHLFFACNYAKQFWNRVCLKIGYIGENGNETVRRYTGMEQGNTITSIIRRLSIAASVYLIWRERNCRLFKEERRSVEELFELFCDTIKLRLASLKAKPSMAVIKAQEEWKVQMLVGVCDPNKKELYLALQRFIVGIISSEFGRIGVV